MAVNFGQGPVFPSVSALPSAASNNGRVLVQGGKLWYSDGSTWADLTLGSTSNPPWYGKVYGAYGRCDPQELLLHIARGSIASPTPTNIGTSVARCSYFRPPADITVNKIRWLGVGTTTSVYRVAIYNADTLARLTPEIVIAATAASTWGAETISGGLTLTAGQLYFIAVSVNATGATSGIAAFGTSVAAATGRIAVLPKSYPGNLDVDAGYLDGALAQFAVTTGALPDPAASISEQVAWTSGMPAFWLDNSSA